MDPTLFPIPVNAPGVVAYNQQRDLIWLLEQAVIIALPVWLLVSGGGAKLRDWLARGTGRGWLVLPLFAACYLLMAAIVVLPTAWWREVALREAWGRSAPGLGVWLGGKAGPLLVQVMSAGLLAWIPFTLMRRWPRWWWAPVSALAFCGLCAALVVEPIWVRPMTTRIAPFPEGPALSQMQAIAKRCGLAPVPIFTGGVDTGATAVGLGPVARILFPRARVEEALAEGREAELVSVFAHELQHYRRDNWIAIGVVALICVGGALLVQIVGGLAIRRWGKRFGVPKLSDPAALPLILLILATSWTFAGAPAFNAFQRGLELEADRFALEMTHDTRSQPTVLARSNAKGLNVVEYYPFYEVFRATHPSDAERVRLANAWRPWEAGRTGRYGAECPASGNPNLPAS